MIVLEHPFQDIVTDVKSLELLGLGLVSMTQKKSNIILMKGINSSLLMKLIKNYKEEIIEKVRSVGNNKSRFIIPLPEIEII